MQSLGINKQKIHYALYQGKTDIVDEFGMKTGEKEKSYSTPAELKINISAAKKGEADVSPFGVSADYTKVMSTCDMSCPIDEQSILWVGIDTSKRNNYIVVKVAKSINSILYAIKEV